MERQSPVDRGAIAQSPATAPRQGASLRDPDTCGRAVSAGCRGHRDGKGRGPAAEGAGEEPAARSKGALTIPGPSERIRRRRRRAAGRVGATVKRVDRLARLAPDLLLKVAAGQLSAKKALNEALTRTDAKLRP